MAWIPDAGDIFVVRFKPRTRLVEHSTEHGVVVLKETTNDRAYMSDVFRCKASDESTVVAVRVVGFEMNNKNTVLTTNFHEFRPVSPEVKAALGLSEDA